MGSQAACRRAARPPRRAPGPSGPIYVGLFSVFSLERDHRPLNLPLSAQRLVAYLALQERPSLRSHIAGTLWSEIPDDRAMTNLRSIIWRLRHLDEDILASTGGQLALSDRVLVELRILRRIALDILDEDGLPTPEECEMLANSGELLPDWPYDWVLVDRERFRQLRLHALESLCGQLAASGQFGRAVEACLTAVAADTLRESAQRLLIEVYLSEGNRFEALRQFRSYQALVRDELGVEPSREIADLVRPLTGTDARVTDRDASS